MTNFISRLFEKKWRIESRLTGRGSVDWTHRTRWGAAWDATVFDWIEAMADLPRNDWYIVPKYRKD